MSRSTKKGPYTDEWLLKKLARYQPGPRIAVNTWSRAAVITPEMIGYTLGVHNGKTFQTVSVTEEMVGHRLGEFSKTRMFLPTAAKYKKNRK